MALKSVTDQIITDRYSLFCGDSVEVMAGLPEARVHFSIYSPPFGGLYNYSSSEHDLSNCDDYQQFLEHYAHFVAEIARITMPGRLTAVHCTDIALSNSGCDALLDLPGDIIRLHEKHGFRFCGRYAVWKEPLQVRMRTLVKGLAHKTIIEDSSRCSVASADYLVCFRKRGENPVPIAHPQGLIEYAGATPVPKELLKFRGWKGSHLNNSYSHWIWRRYASAFWDDVRLDRVLPFKPARDEEDEKHVHPLQLDVIERAVTLWSNPGETVLTPFMGVGSEVFGAVRLGRKGLGVELKPSYYRQAVRNLETVDAPQEAPIDETANLFDEARSDGPEAPDGATEEAALDPHQAKWSKTAKRRASKGWQKPELDGLAEATGT